jgi:hypothetical protein
VEIVERRTFFFIGEPVSTSPEHALPITIRVITIRSIFRKIGRRFSARKCDH